MISSHSPEKQLHIYLKSPPRDLRNLWSLNIIRHSSNLRGTILHNISSVQFISVTQLCPTLCDPMNPSTPGLPVHHQPPEFTQTHVHRVGYAIQPSHPLLAPSPFPFSLSQHQRLFQRIGSLYQVAKVLAFQLQHQ